MLINSYNSHLYNLNKFDEYNNIYAIKINKNSKIYKIVYGHFYNNYNEFIYKKVVNNKIINTEVFRCRKNELFYNDEYNLIYSKSFNAINNYLKYSLKNKTKE